MALKSLWARWTAVDRSLGFLLIVVVLCSIYATWGRPAGSEVLIYQGDRLFYAGPLNQDRQLRVKGPLGTTQVNIHAGAVSVTDSPCPRKICIGMGRVKQSGDLLACVPNEVVVRIAGQETGAYDLLSR